VQQPRSAPARGDPLHSPVRPQRTSASMPSNCFSISSSSFSITSTSPLRAMEVSWSLSSGLPAFCASSLAWILV